MQSLGTLLVAAQLLRCVRLLRRATVLWPALGLAPRLASWLAPLVATLRKGASAPFLLIVRAGQFLRNCRKPPQLFSKRAAFFHRLDGFVGECQFVPRASFPRFKYAIGRKSLDARIVPLIERRIEIAHHDIQRVVQDEFVIRNRPREAAHNTYV